MSGEVFFVNPNEVELCSNEALPQKKETTGCFPIAFSLSDMNLKFGFVNDSNIIKMGEAFYQSGVFVGRGVYHTACFLGSMVFPS